MLTGFNEDQANQLAAGEPDDAGNMMAGSCWD